MRNLSLWLATWFFVFNVCPSRRCLADSVYGEGTLPVSGSSAAVVGVVYSFAAEPSLSGPEGPYYRLKLSRTFKGQERSLLVLGHFLRSGDRLKAGAIIFAYKQNSRYDVNGETAWILGRSVWAGGTEQEQAIEAYFAHAEPRDRLVWAKAYLNHAYGLLSFSAWLELGRLARTGERASVLEFLLASTSPSRVHYLATYFADDAHAHAALKALALDRKQNASLRAEAAEGAMSGDPKLLEAWKDGREGADAELRAYAEQRWNAIHPPPKPLMTEGDFASLRSAMQQQQNKKLLVVRDAMREHQADARFLPLLLEVMDDPGQRPGDRELAYSYCRDLPFTEVGEELAKRALDQSLSEPFRFQAVFALCMGQHPNRKEMLQRIVDKTEIEKHRVMAKAMLNG